MDSERIRVLLRFTGRVQGVGFRYCAEQAANRYRVTGWVRNDPDGGVSMEAEGRPEEIDQVIASLENGRYISVDSIDKWRIPLRNDRSFRIIEE